jgi:hypothetical protein
MYCASSKEGTVWYSVCDPVAQCILPNTKSTPGHRFVGTWPVGHIGLLENGGGGPKSNFWWENDDKPPGFVRHICNQTLLVVDQNQCALIFTSTWFDCIKAQPQIYGIIHRPWPIPRISHCSLLISKRNPSRLFAQKRCNFCHAVAPGLFHHRATVVIWGHNPPHRPPTVPVQW